jgi:Ca-activated chloride channel family protein
MSFIWPTMLLTLLIVPVLAYVYVRVSARRDERRAELGTMGELRTTAGKPVGRRRHIPVILFLVGLTVLLVGLARPQTTLALPRHEGTVILAFDTSNSMVATDIKPSRIKAAKQAAKSFVEQQPSSIRIGVVAFSDSAFVVQKPTRSKQDVLNAIAQLSPGGGTSVGDGILTSLGAIAGKHISIDAQALQDGTPQKKVPFLGSAAVVLLSDGENTSKLDPVATADIASQAGVRVDPIGLGSTNGAVVTIDGFSIATSLDADLLKQVAKSSNGTYYHAAQAAALRNVYNSIDLKLTIHGEKTEVTSLFAAGGVLLLLIAAVLSMRWFGRVP